MPPNPYTSKQQLDQPKELPKPRSVTYYSGEAINADLLDEQAELLAKEFKQIASSQLRRFYEHVLSIRRRLDTESQEREKREEIFLRLRPEFKLLKAKAAYTWGRDGHGQKYKPLAQFFIDHTHAVNTARDFEAFCKHFEAVLAFHKFYSESKER